MYDSASQFLGIVAKVTKVFSPLEIMVQEELSGLKRSWFRADELAEVDVGSGGEWLIRQVIGLVRPEGDRMDYLNRMTGFGAVAEGAPGGLAIDAKVRPGDRLRFHVRDGSAARDDMRLQLARFRAERAFGGGAAALGTPRAALMFTCVGRGKALFGERGHDSAAFGAEFPGVPLGGLYANGEIGPVGASMRGVAADRTRQATHLHTFTTVFAVICDLDPDSTASP